MLAFANDKLNREKITNYTDIDETTEEGQRYIQQMKKLAVKIRSYFFKPFELFSSLEAKGGKPAARAKPLADVKHSESLRLLLKETKITLTLMLSILSNHHKQKLKKSRQLQKWKTKY